MGLTNVIERRLMTVPEAAAYMHLSKRYIYEMIKQGRLPAVRLGRRQGTRIDRQSLDDALDMLCRREAKE